MNPQSQMQKNHLELPTNVSIEDPETHPESDFCFVTPTESVPVPILDVPVPEGLVEVVRIPTETPIDSQSCECATLGCQKCNLLLNSSTRKVPLKKKMPFPMSAFIVSGVGMFLLCTLLSVTIAEVEVETAAVEESPKGFGPPNRHHDLSIFSVDHHSTGHHDVTKLSVKPIKQIYVTKHSVIIPLISYELLQKIKYLLMLPIEFIQWLIPPFILIKQFLMTLIMFLVKLLDVRNDFKDGFHFDENELDDSLSREL